MVYVDPNELGWRPYVTKWMKEKMEKIKEETRHYIMDLFDAYVEDGIRLDFTRIFVVFNRFQVKLPVTYIKSFNRTSVTIYSLNAEVTFS